MNQPLGGATEVLDWAIVSDKGIYQQLSRLSHARLADGTS